MANSGAILANLGTEMDLIRPGLALFGLSPGKWLINWLSDCGSNVYVTK